MLRDSTLVVQALGNRSQPVLEASAPAGLEGGDTGRLLLDATSRNVDGIMERLVPSNGKHDTGYRERHDRGSG